jgi:pimeloyl-ACP methyl ester carboxylesterase
MGRGRRVDSARTGALADRIAHGKLIKVPRAAHLVQEDAPEAIVAAMFDR